ncbi:MAG: asparagine synthase (glutamine-hydrolyzing) [Myxococcota bacterium]|jgi:asparagine synthase (glutamine-hydrolysing)|nr:asparagine synthase (glutamine-hydrolyzing) [Myxococcota bacterium]
MCGVAGLVAPAGRPVERDLVRRMTQTLRRRGPDAEGFYFASGVGLGHRRLSIVDVKGGQQPFLSTHGRVAAVVNGEIYNHRSLRNDLVRRGHKFQTGSDCEVLLHGYEEEGTAFFHRLNGMFAAAIWDARGPVPQLVLARDPMGQKPLYFAPLPDGSLAFASELKGLLVHEGVDRHVSAAALARYLVYEYVPAPWSIVEGARKLLPGHFLVWSADTGQIRSGCYYRLPLGAADKKSVSDDRVILTFSSLLKRAVERHLMAEVPLGVFLSGGLDSSAIVANMAQLMDPREIRTFTISFDDRSFDESAHAALVARHFGTQHHCEVLRPEDALDLIPDIADWLDEPFGDASLVPTHLLCRATRQHVTVALGGDGADELLGGYPTFVADGAARLFERLPRSVRQAAGEAVGLLPVSMANFSLDFKARSFLKGIPFRGLTRHQVWLGSFGPDGLRRVLAPGLLKELPDLDPFSDLDRRLADLPVGESLDRLIAYYTRFYLADDILTKTDRASMACSLEVRAPFLDLELLEGLARLPDSWKVRLHQTKRVLRESMRGLLPASTLRRGKKGFGMPVARWLRGDLRQLLERLLDPYRLEREGYFRGREVERLVREHLAGRADHRKPLWTLMVFQLWLERHGPR